jgi:hypothetical protein
MAKRTIDTEMWNDPKLTDDFTPEDKYFWLFCLTTKFGNLSGVFEVSYKQIAKEMGYNETTVKNLIYRFTHVHKLITYVEASKELFIHNWFKYNWTKSPRFETALKSFINKIKDEELKIIVEKMYEDYKNGDTVCIPYRYGSISIPISNTNIFNYKEDLKDQIKEENKSVQKTSKKKFIPPTLQDVEEYCKQRKNNVEPKKFFDYFNVAGWVDSNGKQVKNWKQKIITWESHSNKIKEDNNAKREETIKKYVPRRQRSS